MLVTIGTYRVRVISNRTASDSRVIIGISVTVTMASAKAPLARQ